MTSLADGDFQERGTIITAISPKVSFDDPLDLEDESARDDSLNKSHLTSLPATEPTHIQIRLEGNEIVCRETTRGGNIKIW